MNLSSLNNIARVSVVVPCYKCTGTIDRAIESVANQTLLPQEVILIDDCSNDDTWEKLLFIQKKYGFEWIKVFSLEKNSGPATARNMGWDLAKGDFIAFLDSDDSWHPLKIETQYHWMNKNPQALLTGHKFAINNSSLVKEVNAVEFSNRKSSPKRISPRVLLFSNVFLTPGVMIKRAVVLRMNPGRKYSEDYDLWLRLAYLPSGECYLFDDVLGYIHKNHFGDSGLSSRLVAMEIGELTNLVFVLFKYNEPVAIFAILYSFAKFIRRGLLSGLRKIC